VKRSTWTVRVRESWTRTVVVEASDVAEAKNAAVVEAMASPVDGPGTVEAVEWSRLQVPDVEPEG